MKKLESYLVRAQIKIKLGPVKAENSGFEIEFPIMVHICLFRRFQRILMKSYRNTKKQNTLDGEFLDADHAPDAKQWENKRFS